MDNSRPTRNAEIVACQIEKIAQYLEAWEYVFDAATFRRVAQDLRKGSNRRPIPQPRYFQEF